MSKPRRTVLTGNCAYCGKETEVEDDHVIPRSLFVDVNQSKVTVPACVQCDRKKSKGEDDLRDYMVIAKRAVGHPVADALVGTVVKSTRKGFSRVGEAAIRATWQPHYTKSGIYLGQEITGDTSDVRFMIPTLRYMIRGLFYHERQARLPADLPYRIFVIPPERFHLTLADWAKKPHPDPRVLGDRVFWWVPYIPEALPEKSGWVMCFYDGLLVVGITGVDFPEPPEERPPGMSSKNRRRLERLTESGLLVPPPDNLIEVLADLVDPWLTRSSGR